MGLGSIEWHGEAPTWPLLCLCVRPTNTGPASLGETKTAPWTNSGMVGPRGDCERRTKKKRLPERLKVGKVGRSPTQV